MNLILLGAPGAGKGTQAEMLVKRLNIPSISTGNMLREAMANGSELGKQVKQAMDEGKLVSDELVLGITAQRVAQPDCKNGYILDGVPRTLVQAEALEQMGVVIDYVVSIEIDDAVIEGRMTGRRVCPKCGATYHITANPTKVEGICDQCGSEVIIRKDDAPETVKSRLATYHATTEVLKDFYGKRGKLKLISGDQQIENVFADILKAIGVTV